MAQFTNAQVEDLNPGMYQLVYQSAGGAGTGKIEISMDEGSSYQDMTNGSFTTSEDKIAYLGKARYRFTLTGDAKLWLTPTNSTFS